MAPPTSTSTSVPRPAVQSNRSRRQVRSPAHRDMAPRRWIPPVANAGRWISRWRVQPKADRIRTRCAPISVSPRTGRLRWTASRSRSRIRSSMRVCDCGPGQEPSHDHRRLSPGTLDRLVGGLTAVCVRGSHTCGSGRPVARCHGETSPGGGRSNDIKN